MNQQPSKICQVKYMLSIGAVSAACLVLFLWLNHSLQYFNDHSLSVGDKFLLALGGVALTVLGLVAGGVCTVVGIMCSKSNFKIFTKPNHADKQPTIYSSLIKEDNGQETVSQDIAISV